MRVPLAGELERRTQLRWIDASALGKSPYGLGQEFVKVIQKKPLTTPD